MKRFILSLTIGFLMIYTMTGCAITIVPIDEETSEESGNDVAAFWDSQAVPEIRENSIEIASFLNEANGNIGSLADKYGHYSNGDSGNLNYAVYGTGTIKEVKAETKAGYIALELEGYSGNVKVDVQIGSIFKGTTMRDYLSFIDINDYQDQIAFAQISKDINTYIGENVVDYNALKEAAGETVEFYGCFTYSDDEAILITPSELVIK